MPEHIHLLTNERFDLPLDQFIKAVNQETSRLLKGDREHFWQKRYYDANIHTDEGDSFYETIRYIHRNPVKRGLADSPGIGLYPPLDDHSGLSNCRSHPAGASLWSPHHAG